MSVSIANFTFFCKKEHLNTNLKTERQMKFKIKRTSKVEANKVK